MLARGLRPGVTIQHFFNSSRKKNLEGRKAWAPAHWTCADFPPVTHSREITGNTESLSEHVQNVSRFD